MQSVTFTFPENTLFARDFFACLKSILMELPNAKEADGDVTLFAVSPEHALPVTNFRTNTQAHIPAVEFDHNKGLSQVLNRFQPSQAKPESYAKKHDELGIYYETSTDGKKAYGLPLQELRKRLQGHIVRIDHTGLNIPAKKASAKEWDDLLRVTALECALYEYPTGEPWPFILPATKQEFETGITAFPVGREPKFELVHDSFSLVPTIQIDIETDLERPEIERLFPSPYAVSWPNLAEYFRTVYVYHEWPGLIIRFDLRYKSDNPEHDWNTGKWLVMDGGRVSPGYPTRSNIPQTSG